MLLNLNRLKVLASYLEEAGGISLTRWNMMNSKERKDYVEKHPTSKYATWDMFKKDIDNNGMFYKKKVIKRDSKKEIKKEKNPVAIPVEQDGDEACLLNYPEGKEYKLDDAIKAATDFISKEELRYYIGGIHYLNEDYIEATNGCTLIRIKTKVPKNLIGKIINPKTNEEIDGAFPDCDRVFPKGKDFYDKYKLSDLQTVKEENELKDSFSEYNCNFRLAPDEKGEIHIAGNISKSHNCMNVRKYLNEALDSIDLSADEKKKIRQRDYQTIDDVKNRIREKAKEFAIENDDFNHRYTFQFDNGHRADGAISSEVNNTLNKTFKKLKSKPEYIYVSSDRANTCVNSPFVYGGDGFSILAMPIRLFD